MNQDYTETPEWNALTTAHYHCQEAATHAAKATAVFADRGTKSLYHKWFLERIASAADALGYDLVKRESVEIEEAA